jgi:membrane-associated phospholipid phosphatase
MAFWRAVTAVGSCLVMVPVAATIAGQLAVIKAWRDLGLWVASLATAIGVTAASKIAYIGWGLGNRQLEFTGISGHAMLASTVLPVVGHLMIPGPALAGGTAAAPGRLAVVAGFCAAICIGLSRIILGYHSPADVITGCLLGGGTAWIFMIRSRRPPARSSPAPMLVLLVLAPMIVWAVPEVPTDRWVESIALFLAGRPLPGPLSFDAEKGR